MKENWTDDMRKKLEGHKMAPPPDLWEGISQQMGLESEAAPAKKTVAIKRWYGAVAAVILALVGFFAFYQTDDQQSQLQANHTDTPEQRSILRTPQETVAEAVMTEPIAKTVAKPMAKAAAIKQPVPTETIQHPVEPVVSDEPTISEIPESQPQEVTESEPVSEEPNLQASVEPNYLPEVVDIVPNYSSSEQSDKWTIGLSASSGGLLAANANNHDERIPVYSHQNSDSYKSDSETNFGSIISGNAPYTHTDLVSSHRLPLRFGLSLHYQLNPRLTLISGINYTYLYSEFTIPLYQSISYHQKLHYLGIPLGVAWQLWSTGNFHLYLSGRTMVEKCVSAKVSSGDLNQHPWQWSVNASVGAEYNLSRLLGLYLEPSLGYYFNDGTSLEHYYKEHPLAPAIEFGLRLHLSGN